jgi:hypothetical protein
MFIAERREPPGDGSIFAESPQSLGTVATVSWMQTCIPNDFAIVPTRRAASLTAVVHFPIIESWSLTVKYKTAW